MSDTPTRADFGASGRGWAPGKIILLGEHAVVYGRPAIAATIEQGLEVNLSRRCGAGRGLDKEGDARDPRLTEALQRAAQSFDLSADEIEICVNSALPAGVGLGSSAALSVAMVRALADLTGTRLGETEVSERAFEVERIFHGNPSGIDNSAVAYGGLISFRHGDPPRRIACVRTLRVVVGIGNSERETKRIVGALRSRWQSEPARYDRLFDEVAAVVAGAETAIGAADLTTLGELMNENQRLLAQLGISTPELDEMIACAREHGALGAKLTGGGGGGAVICLAGEAGRVVSGLEARGWRAMVTEIRAGGKSAPTG